MTAIPKTNYERFQQEKYGNVLEQRGDNQELENGEIIMQEQLVWFEREEEVWLEEQSL
jgi:hypothetical protein